MTVIDNNEIRESNGSDKADDQDQLKLLLNTFSITNTAKI